MHMPQDEHREALTRAKRAVKPGGEVHVFDNDPEKRVFEIFGLPDSVVAAGEQVADYEKVKELYENDVQAAYKEAGDF